MIFVGKLGCGKSVLFANILDDLHLSFQSSETILVHFFCRYDTAESLKATTIVGSLVRQVLERLQHISNGHLDVKGPTSTSSWCIEQMVELLLNFVTPKTRLIFIVDGLDECLEKDRLMVLSTLHQLQEATAVLCLISMRREASSALQQTSCRLVDPLVVRMKEDTPEIASFIDAQLASCLDSGKLVLGDPSLVLEIKDSLAMGADGIFLWVSLQIDTICSRKTDYEIRQALLDLPASLEETFRRILERLSYGQPRSVRRQSEIFQLVVAAKRPLTLEEMNEALNITPGTSRPDTRNAINDIYSTLALCGSLLTFDEEELTIRLVHHSVYQFLCEGHDSLPGSSFTLEKAHQKFAGIIITYLRSMNVDKQVSSVVLPKISVATIPTKLIRSTIARTTAQGLAIKLLRSSKVSKMDIGKVLAEAGNLYRDFPITDSLYSYARQYVLSHLTSSSHHEDWVFKTLFHVLQAHQITPLAPDGRSVLSVFCGLGNVDAVRQMLSSGADINQRDNSDGRTCLHWAAIRGDIQMTKLLVSMPDMNKLVRDSIYGCTALQWAISRGVGEIATLLRERSTTPPRTLPVTLLFATAQQFEQYSGLGISDFKQYHNSSMTNLSPTNSIISSQACTDLLPDILHVIAHNIELKASFGDTDTPSDV